MSISSSLRSLSLLAVGVIVIGAAHAAQNSANASASVQGYDPVRQSSAGTGNLTTASAALDGKLGAGDVFVSAMASGLPGILGATASSRGATTGSPATDIVADASSTWSDSFRIVSPGRDGQTGTLTGSVQVSGGMLTQYGGRAFAMTGVAASIDTFTGTGFNGGRVHLDEFAQVFVGYDGFNGRRGSPDDDLRLVFTVPFTFNQNIDFSMSLAAHASARLLGGVEPLIGPGSARSMSDYSHTMTWGGLSDVRDSSGQLVADFSAMSVTSDFDFRSPAVVPEPSQSALLLAGLLAGGIAWRARLRREERSAAKARA